jgi:hypothetical protein
MRANFSDSRSDREDHAKLLRTVHDFWFCWSDTCRISEQHTDWRSVRLSRLDVFALIKPKNLSSIQLMTDLEMISKLFAMMKLETKLWRIEKMMLRSWSRWENLICEFNDLQTKMIVDSRIWLIRNIKLTEKKISDSTILIKMIESRRSNCTDCLNRERDCEFDDLKRDDLIERSNCRELIKERDCRFDDLNKEMIWSKRFNWSVWVHLNSWHRT